MVSGRWAAAGLTILATAMLLTSTKKLVLEQEIGEYGTGLNTQQSLDADNLYENTFQDDPGHISRAEIRFNAALKAAGGQDMHPLAQTRAPLAAASSSSSGWAAYPVLSKKRKTQGVTVNIVEGRGRKEHRHGMSASEARGDLESYFSSLGNQLKAQERKHAQQLLNSLSSSSSSSLSSSSSSSSSSDAALGGHRGRQVPRQERRDQKLSALMKLVEKAAHSQKFQRALVSASKGKFRQSLVGDFE